MGASGVIPVLHKLVLFWNQPEALHTTGNEVLMGAPLWSRSAGCLESLTSLGTATSSFMSWLLRVPIVQAWRTSGGETCKAAESFGGVFVDRF
jgi:hypothetical protein